ncbi:hypothetical protein BGZ82_008391 [Podila clonocystis]|nr:hypothetical protein BGZ82_008391 [Podila clonocystis]
MSPGPKVNIPGRGKVQGATATSQPTVAKFLNIPFATVPERWRPAIKATAWKGIHDGTKQGPVCPQPKSDNPWNNINTKGIDEDNDEEGYNRLYSEEHCLNLNVFVPKDHLAKALHLIPVMVFIYGGGFRDGSNAMALYDATNMCAQSIQLGRPVVVVAINYRLNYLGFMSSAELVQDINSDPRLSSATGNNHHNKSVGNWGLLDQKLALEWVRDHIHVFGGNSQDVTAFGESAGAASIGFHLTIPEHHGLFQRAILQSGAVNTMPAGRAQIEGQRYFNHLCKHFGLLEPALSSAQRLDALRKIPARELVKAGDRGKVGMFTPTIDDVLIHGDSREWVHDPARYDPGLKSIMLGDCRDEGQTFVTTLGARKMKQWPKFFARNCPPGLEAEFEAIYGIPTTDGEAARISSEVVRDSVFLYPIHATSRAVLSRPGVASVEMSRFHFDRPLKALEKMGLHFLGAHHAAELLFVFGSDSALKMMTDDEQRLSRQMTEHWILFAWGETSRRFGLSQGVDSLLPSDIGVGGQKREAIVFIENCTVEKGLVERLDSRKLAFWRTTEQWVKEKRDKQYQAFNQNAKL